MAELRRTRILMVWAVAQLILTLSNVPKSTGLTYDEFMQVIPQAVRDAENVTVARATDGMVTITFKGLPNHGTMMVNPNDATEQNYQVTLPEDPVAYDDETCTGGGPIGWTIHGVSLYNPFNALGTNAVEGDEAETFDSCQGHPDNRGSYHYHQLPDICVFPDVDTNVHGIALDGFPIYGPYKEDGTMVQEDELDKCHGRCGDDGKYRYHMTKNYPYILGCYRGKPMTYTAGGGMGGPPQGGGDRPPPPEGGGDRPPRPDSGGRRKRQSPNQCAYNRVQGDNYEFKACSAQTGPGVGSTRGPDGGSRHLEATIALVCMACFIAVSQKMFCY